MPFNGAAKALFATKPSAKKLQKVSRKHQDRVLLREDNHDEELTDFLSAGRHHSININNPAPVVDTRPAPVCKPSPPAPEQLFKPIDWSTTPGKEVSTANVDITWMNRAPKLPVVPLIDRPQAARPLPTYHNTADTDSIKHIQSTDILNRMRALGHDLHTLESLTTLPIDIYEPYTIKHQIRALERQDRALILQDAMDATRQALADVVTPPNFAYQYQDQSGKVTTGTASIVDLNQSRQVGPRRSLQTEIISVPARKPLSKAALLSIKESELSRLMEGSIPEIRVTQFETPVVPKAPEVMADDLSWLRLDEELDDTIRKLEMEAIRSDSPTLGVDTSSLPTSCAGDNTVSDIDIGGNFDDEYFRLWEQAVDAFGA